MRITSAPHSELVGRYLSELAEERAKSGFDLVADLILESEAPISITLGAIAEEDVRALLVQPWNMVASDGGYPGGDPGEGHPRSAGTFPRVLGHYVRELKLLSLEDAIRKMTSLPASNLGLHDRGRLAEGMAADITVFDPETIADRSTWEDEIHGGPFANYGDRFDIEKQLMAARDYVVLYTNPRGSTSEHGKTPNRMADVFQKLLLKKSCECRGSLGVA